MYTYSKPVLGLSAIQSAKSVELVLDYEQALMEDGYNPHAVRFHVHSVAHFVVWFELQGAELETMDEAAVAAFVRHRRSASVVERRAVAAGRSFHAFGFFCAICGRKARFRPPRYRPNPASWWVSSCGG